MNIDKQRVRGVDVLEQLGYRWDGAAWLAPAATPASDPIDLTSEADAMHGLLMERADTLAAAIEGADDEDELAAIGAALEAYEAKRWPGGKIPGGKG